MFNIFRSKKTFGQLVKSQAREQFPGFLVSSGFSLAGIGIMTVGVRVAQGFLEKKAPRISQQSQQSQQPQPPQQP